VKIDPIRDRGRKGEYAKIYASNAKAQKLLGWKPKTDLEESIINLANWYKTHPRGYST